MRHLLSCLRNESLRPSQLQNHLEKNHPGLKGKDIEYFKRLQNGLKRQRLDNSGSFALTDKKLTEASFEVSILIAKQKKAHNIGETLVKPSALAMVRIVLNEESERKIQAIPLSDNTVQRRIALMANDIKEQVVTEVKDKALFGLFALQLDEWFFRWFFSTPANGLCSLCNREKCERKAALLQ